MKIVTMNNSETGIMFDNGLCAYYEDVIEEIEYMKNHNYVDFDFSDLYCETIYNLMENFAKIKKYNPIRYKDYIPGYEDDENAMRLYFKFDAQKEKFFDEFLNHILKEIGKRR